MTTSSVMLRDGSAVHIRRVQPGDAQVLAEGFSRLSNESRQLRFLSGKSTLSPEELRYFTDIDHHDHEAFGAVDAVHGRGLGVARYIRNVDDPQGAEVAVAIVDDWQGRGLGTELLSRLVDRGRQEGIRHFTALVAADNAAMVGLLQHSHMGVRITEREHGAVSYEVTLPPHGLGEDLHALLRAFGHRQSGLS